MVSAKRELPLRLVRVKIELCRRQKRDAGAAGWAERAEWKVAGRDNAQLKHRSKRLDLLLVAVDPRNRTFFNSPT